MIIKTSYPFMKPPPSARLIRGHRLAQGLVGFWTMAENGGLQVFDLSENGNTGFLNGTAPSWTSGKFGSAVLLPGTNEYINIDTVQGDLSSSTKGTWSIWVKITDITSDGIFISFGDTDANTQMNLRITGFGRVGATCKLNGSDRWVFDTDSVMFSNDVWAHVALVQDGIEPILYVNGVVPVTQFVTSTDKTAWFNDLSGIDNGRIGSLNRNSGGEILILDGQVDLPMIYNRDLSASEIGQLYAKPFGMFERRARTALMSGYEVVAPSGIVVYTHHYQQQL